ncbi:MAG: NfeD family protein, partial [Actinobacteria bacterium]|nr:NfeD family protein [Actinomycetota bacterium]
MDDDTIQLVVWIVAAVALFAIEATTIAFVALYFGVGALAAALAAALGTPLAVQALVFA